MAKRRFGLISDTHGHVHRDVYTLLEGVETILHAGDVGGDVMMELSVIAPVLAVRGNTDSYAEELPNYRIEELPFGIACIVHGDHQSVSQHLRAAELRKLFQAHNPRIIMHGHSHQQYLDHREGCWVINPGAAGKPRFGVQPGLAILTWDEESDRLSIEFVTLRW